VEPASPLTTESPSARMGEIEEAPEEREDAAPAQPAKEK
jgi:hypothetical protein